MAYGIVVKRAKNNIARMKSPGRTIDSSDSRIDGKQRVSASQYYEKYTLLAREALSSGDRVAAENYFQHAEHFFRLMNENRHYHTTESFQPKLTIPDDEEIPFFLRAEMDPEPDFEEAITQ